MRIGNLWLCSVPWLMLIGAAATSCLGKFGSPSNREEERVKMVSEQILARGVKDERILNAMR